MAKITFSGINEYIDSISKLYNIEPITGKAIFEGAKIIADNINSEINSLPVNGKMGSEENKIDGLSNRQKQGLIDGLGISKMDKQNGFKNVKIGFSGYNNFKTKKFPNGQPNILIARSIIKGTSFRKKNDFINRAVKKSKSECENKMKQTIENEIKKLTGE